MWISKCEWKKMCNRVQNLEQQAAIKIPTPIGEVYHKIYTPWLFMTAHLDWQTFFMIEDKIEGKLKILGKWFDTKDVIIYKDYSPINKAKEQIQKRLDSKIKK